MATITFKEQNGVYGFFEGNKKIPTIKRGKKFKVKIDQSLAGTIESVELSDFSAYKGLPPIPSEDWGVTKNKKLDHGSNKEKELTLEAKKNPPGHRLIFFNVTVTFAGAKPPKVFKYYDPWDESPG